MANYQKMYYILCNAASKAIDMPPMEAKRFLRQALEEAEEIYIQSVDGDADTET